MSIWHSIARSKKPPLWSAMAVSIVLVVAMALLQLGVSRRFALPIGYGVPIVLLALFRSRRVLWSSVLAFAFLNVVKFWVLLPDTPPAVHVGARQYDWLEGAMVLLDLFLVTAIADVWIATQNWLDAQRTDLESANSELASREEEIARQNEELQSQTEELERQSEELRGANEELAHREKTLEILLSLSRSLHTELSESEVMERICETLGLLVNGPTTAAAILEQAGQTVRVRCHHGFGPDGLREDTIAAERSLAGLVLSKGRTGYIEDLTLRPDLTSPQPKEGEPMLAVLATPLRMSGRAIGSLEVYSRHKTTWNQEQIALVESLAAQASVSLEAAQLFQTVAAERNRFQAVLRTVPVGVAVADPQCTDIRVNPAGAAMLNVPVDQNLANPSLARSWQGFINGKPLNPQESPLLRAAREGIETQAQEIEMVAAGGRRLVLLAHARPIRGADGAIQGAVGTFADITAMRELNRELDLRRREAEEASVRKTRFLAAVSHDIRTPANAISLLAELIRRTAGNPALAQDIPELAQELHGSATSLVNLLSDVLDLARFDSDKVDMQESEFPLAELLQDEQRQLLPLARQKGLSLVVNAPSAPLVLRTDRIKLARILGNLLGNAIKFTEQGGIEIDAHCNADGSIRIAIRDTGIGIAPEYLTHIFDEFFQLRNPERDRAKGSGLGLTICKRLVDAIGGTLGVESAPGQGSTFTVTLPAFVVVPQPAAMA